MSKKTSKKKTTFKTGDKVLYAILGKPEYEWEVTSTFTVSDGTVLCLSRPDDTKKLKVDRCNAPDSLCVLKLKE